MLKANIKKHPQRDGEIGWRYLAKNSSQTVGQPQEGDISVDAAIIGAGFSGLSTAWRLAELRPDWKIALIDAQEIGEGSSGRNAGFIIDIPHNVDAQKDNSVQQQTYRLNNFAIERLHQAVQAHDIPCDWQHRCGKYLAAHLPKHQKMLDDFAAMLDFSKFSYRRLNAAEMRQRLGTDYYCDGIYTDGNILVNPAALIIGLASTLPENIAIYTKTPISHLAKDKNGYQLHSAQGVITTKQLVIATNAYSEAFSTVASRQIPAYTYASITEPIKDKIYHSLFNDIKPWGLTSAHQAGTSVRLLPDKRLFFRNCFSLRAQLRCRESDLVVAKKYHYYSLAARFPALASLSFEYTWGGMIALTRNHQSFFQQLDDNAWLLSGHNGVGLAKGTYMGHYLAEWMCGQESAELRFIQAHNKPNFVPAEPLKSLAANIVMRWAVNRAGDEV